MAIFTGAIAVFISVTFTDSIADPPSMSQVAPQSVGEAETPGILVSRQLLEAQQLVVGDVVHLSADPDGSNPSRFRIVGSYEPTPDPMRVTSERLEARLHLPDLLTLTADPTDPLSAETVSAINVVLEDPSDAALFARDLSAKVPGLIARSTARDEERSTPFIVIKQFHWALGVVTMVASSVFLLTLMLMRAEERREAIGILRLIGVTKHRVLLEVLAEGALIAIAGALGGVLLAAVSQGAFNRFFQWWYDTALVFVDITPSIAWQSIALAVPLGILASVIASWALLRQDLLSLIRR